MGNVVNKKMKTPADDTIADLQANKADVGDVYTIAQIDTMIGDIETLLAAL